MSGTELLDKALVKVESTSIKEWANTPHNRPIFEKIAQNAIDKNKDADPDWLCAYIVCLAIGA